MASTFIELSPETGGGGGGGSVNSVTASSPLSSSGGTDPNISIQVADASNNGYLSSVDWSTFNNKQPAGNYITNLTGDITAAGPGSVVATLADIPNKVYVDFISGLDTNTGTLVRPWKTLQHAYDSISPTQSEPYVIYLSGGNNDSDGATITGKPDTSIVADNLTRVKPLIISGGVTSSQCTYANIQFDSFEWIRNDATSMTVRSINTVYANGFTLKQLGSGSVFVNCINSNFFNCQVLPGTFIAALFTDCSFFGTSTFGDPGISSFSYLTFSGGISEGAITITGQYDLVYFSGFIHDIVYGASLALVSGAGGFAAVEIDSAGFPPTYTGTPSSITYLSRAQYEGYTPAVSGNWNTPPVQVAQALDELAANANNILTSSGTRGSPNSITAAGGIVAGTSVIQAQFVVGNGGPVTVTANPQISAGTTVGQQMILTGTDDTNTVTLNDGTGLELNGLVVLRNGSKLALMWDGSNWGEVSRNGI